MKGKAPKFSTNNLFIALGVLAIVLAFFFLPWATIREANVTGFEILRDKDLNGGGIVTLWLVLIAIIIGVFAVLWEGVYPPSRVGTPIVICAAGVVALIHFGLFFIGNMETLGEVLPTRGIGFWIALVAAIGLATQIFIPRSHLDLWYIFPFEISLKNREAIVAFTFLSVFLTLFSIFVVRAVISAVQMSFYEYKVLPPVQDFIGLDNYRELLNDDVWWISLKNTLIFMVLTVTGTTSVALTAAIAVTQPIKGRDFFRVLLYMPALFSVGAMGLIWVWLLNSQYGIINYFISFIGIRPINWLGDPYLVIPAISLASIWWGFGFPMLIFIAGLQGIPEQLYEAARIDGASDRQLFFHITLPLLRPTILFVTVTGVIAHFQVFGQVLILSNGGPGRSSYSVIFYLYQIAWTAYRMGYGSAVAVTLAAIMATFTAIQFFVIGRRVEY
jgi:multiple sugar transport system permease protein